MTDLCEAARRGAAFLDEVAPRWVKRVRIRSLDLGDCYFCVLGQLHGSYGDGIDRYADEDLGRRAVEFGFSLPIGRESAYHELTRCWKDEIRQRRGAKP